MNIHRSQKIIVELLPEEFEVVEQALGYAGDRVDAPTPEWRDRASRLYYNWNRPSEPEGNDG